jgi:5-methylcytosine-specific restriction endonuclease McrA
MRTPLTREYLNRLYTEENLPIEDICALTGYSRARIFHYLQQFSIPRNKRAVLVTEQPAETKSRSEAPVEGLDHYHRIPGKEWLETRYITDNLSVTEIARELGVNANSVTKALHKHGIPIKPHYMAYRGRVKRISARFRHSIREKIFQRDGYRCCLCGAAENLEVHHIVPRRLGGHNTLDNGVTLCEACHNKIGARETNWIGALLEARGKHALG